MGIYLSRTHWEYILVELTRFFGPSPLCFQSRSTSDFHFNALMYADTMKDTDPSFREDLKADPVSIENFRN